MLSAICFNLDQSKILSSNNGLMHHCNPGHQARYHMSIDPLKKKNMSAQAWIMQTDMGLCFFEDPCKIHFV